MSIKSVLIDYLKSVANDTSEVNMRKDIIPLVKSKNLRIDDTPEHALQVGRFVRLMVSTLPEITAADPHLHQLLPLHTLLKQIYERGQSSSYNEDICKGTTPLLIKTQRHR